MDAMTTAALAVVAALSSREAWAYWQQRMKDAQHARRDVVEFLAQRVDRLDAGLAACTAKHEKCEQETTSLRVELATIKARIK
jgi:ABC-type transporter Mla MlaB component